MKRIRILLLALVVLAVTPSAFAFCSYCGDQGWCVWHEGAGKWCIEGPDYCTEYWGCTARAATADAPSMASQYTLASVEVVTPAETDVRVAEVAAPVRTAELEQPKN